MSNIESPCFECEMRILGCHSDCKAYQDFQVRLQDAKKLEAKDAVSKAYARLNHRRIVKSAAPSQRKWLK